MSETPLSFCYRFYSEGMDIAALNRQASAGDTELETKLKRLRESPANCLHEDWFARETFETRRGANQLYSTYKRSEDLIERHRKAAEALRQQLGFPPIPK